MPIRRARCGRCQAKSADNTLCIIEHFGNADAVPQLPERCLSRKAGIVRCCLLGLSSMASKESNPSLTTIHQEANLRAKTAIECLEAMRDGTEYKPQIVLPADLIKRESTRKL